MNPLIYFLQSIEDEAVIRFIFSNLTKSGLEQLFDLLRISDDITEERWQTIYSKMYLYQSEEGEK